MIDITLLGTGGMMPLPNRHLTSMLLRYNGFSFLVDCGEGTQVALKRAGLSPKPIETMLFTHFHADHISGLTGMLLTMGNADRVDPVIMVGPKGLKAVVNALRVIAPELPFRIEFIELVDREESFTIRDMHIDAFRVNHNVPCYGYSFHIDRLGRFDAEAALALGLPKPFWGRLQKGEKVQYEGKLYSPEQVMGAPRKGLKITYTTDTRPADIIIKNAHGSDLFICEGMYGEEEKLEKAKVYKHMTVYEAAQMASKAEVRKLWLTHYSPSMTRPDIYLASIRNIFPNAYTARDGWSEELKYED